MSPSIRTPGPAEPGSGRALTPPQQPESSGSYDRLEEKLTSLAATMSRWQRDLDSATNRATRLEGAFAVLLSSLEGWKSDIREVASRTEARVLRGLEVIDNRITRSGTAKIESDTARLEEAVQALHAEVAKLHELPPTPAAAEPDTSRLEEAVQALRAEVAKLHELPHAGARLESQILETLEEIKNAPNGVEAEGKTLGAALTVMLESLEAVKDERHQAEQEIQANLVKGLENLEKSVTERMSALSAELGTQQENRIWARLGEGLSILDRRMQFIEERLSAGGNAEMSARLTQALSSLESRLTEGQESLREVLSQASARLPERIEEAVAGTRSAENWDRLTKSLQRLEARLAESQEAFGRKLESVQAGSDENNATQLRYLAGLEELQATLVSRMKILEATLANPLDAQQWERLAKGLEFLDSRLAQSYDSVANRLDTAISALTNTLDNRTAAGQEANLKSAERIWRALTGLEDKVTGSSQATRQSQERIEKATSNLAGALEELRAITGARAGHTEKLLMEALENLDGRFSQNLMAVTESLSSAIFALNKATGEWRSELFNAFEESEERVVKEINDAEAKLAGSLKSGLEALGRREERMLALILGGGAAFSSASEELPTSSD